MKINYIADPDGRDFYSNNTRFYARIYWTMQPSPTGNMLMTAWAYRLEDRCCHPESQVKEVLITTGYRFDLEEAKQVVQEALDKYCGVKPEVTDSATPRNALLDHMAEYQSTPRPAANYRKRATAIHHNLLNEYRRMQDGN
jgi:hypothetical protein